jgi:hypothetical protein
MNTKFRNILNNANFIVKETSPDGRVTRKDLVEVVIHLVVLECAHVVDNDPGHVQGNDLLDLFQIEE